MLVRLLTSLALLIQGLGHFAVVLPMEEQGYTLGQR